MPNTNASFAPINRTYRLEQQIQKLEMLMQEGAVSEALRTFDADTEQLLLNLNCQNGTWLESYKYATLGEAEAIVNLPESAQQAGVRDRFKKSLQQRRQVTFPQFRGHPVKPPLSSLRTRPGSHSQGSSDGASDYRTPQYTRRCPVSRLHGSRSADGTRARA